ncbi:MAG: hypothetical protein NZ930_05790 [Candidatus Bipolaricaulota bacterium]|nr:hypothetical protein [Candidatus Bipolaricaulota bacterium]MDW8030489.1 hypothetical protein [Candidatus Bipolaricaulota bacterium]
MIGTQDWKAIQTVPASNRVDHWNDRWLYSAGKTFVELLSILIELPAERERRRLENIKLRIEVLEEIIRLLQTNPELAWLF